MRTSWICALGVAFWGTTAAAPSVGQPAAPEPDAPAEAALSGRALSRSFSTVVRAIAPAVVRLEVSGVRDDATASGIILDTRGNIVTSKHVLDGWAPGTGSAIRVTLVDGRRVPAELVGVDAAADLAVIQMIEAPGDLSAARFGDSDDASVGEWVLAVGSPLGLDQTFTAGIISGRPELDEPSSRGAFLLTDAKVNPGDAGGPLVDLEGQVIGLTTLISAGPGGSYGYAIPINQVRRAAAAIVKDGHAGHPYIGVGLRDLGELAPADRGRLGALPGDGGAVVSQVGRGTPAARAGLRRGDVITAVDQRQVPTPAELVGVIARQPVGARVVVDFMRDGRTHTVQVSVEDLPAGPR